MYTSSSAISLTPQPTPPPEEAMPPSQPDAALMLVFAARAKSDHEAMYFYAAVLAGIMGLFIVFHMGKFLQGLLPVTVVAFYSSIARSTLKKFTLRPGLGLPSVGHGLLSVAYIALNIVFIFVYSDYDSMPMQSVIAARTGWLALANFCFTVFLSLRNTPLALLTSLSYERLRFLHRIAGLTILIHTVIHGACYSAMFLQQNNAARLRVIDEIYGIVAGFGTVGMVIAALIVRQMSYELFYFLHLTLFIMGLVFISLHHTDISERVTVTVAVAAGKLFLDHAVRLLRLGLYGFNNTAIVHPLPNGRTRVVFKKAPAGARSGQHAFIWIPRIRILETHPFTLANTAPAEFVIAACDGFTHDLHTYAQDHPGATLIACLQGPYGALPDATKYDRVLLVSGGSGASFVIGVALHLLKVEKPNSQQKVTLLWAVKRSTSVEWFAKSLSMLMQQSTFTISVHVTGETASSRRDELQPEIRDLSSSPEVLRGVYTFFKEGDFGMSSNLFITYGRPDVPGAIDQVTNASSPKERVLVMGCGPGKLIGKIRNATARKVQKGGPSVDLYCEQFDW